MRSSRRCATAKKYLWCGNGGSAAEAQHMAAELSGRYLRERPGLHSEALSVNSSTLTCVGNDYGYDHVFSRQVEAFAHPGDVVIGMTTSGSSPNVVLALEAAKRRGAIAVAFTGNGGGRVADVADLSLARARRLRGNRARSPSSNGPYRLRSRRAALDFRRRYPMTPALMAPHARTLFERANGRQILVVGDLMIDEWIWGTVTRISPEAPVPVVAVADHSFTLGGAGNVANNLRALRASVIFAGIVGSDAFADQIRTLLRNEDVDDAGVFAGADRPTTRKTRVVAHNQQVVRADWESTSELEAGDRGRLVEFVRERAAALRRGDPQRLCQRAVFARARGGRTRPVRSCSPIPSRRTSGSFRGVTCVAPNSAEASAMRRHPDRGRRVASKRAGVRLIELLDCRYAIITRGEHGMALFGRDGRTPADTVGRADRLRRQRRRRHRRSRCSDWRLPPARRSSRRCSWPTSLPAQWSRSSAPRRRRPRRSGALELSDVTERRFFGKLFSLDEAAAWRERLRVEKRSVVFTNGCFDLICTPATSSISRGRASRATR